MQSHIQWRDPPPTIALHPSGVGDGHLGPFIILASEK